jgi:cytochrome c553
MNIRMLVLTTVFALSLYSAESFAAMDPGAKLYQSECSVCHVAYPTVFLTTDSWDAVMQGLDDHFGDNAELAANDLASIKAYLDNNNYNQSSVKRRYGTRLDTPGTPLRSTSTRFFKAIHEEVPDRLVTKNPAVKTFARCEACHSRAQEGSFDEDEVRIPR